EGEGVIGEDLADGAFFRDNADVLVGKIAQNKGVVELGGDLVLADDEPFGLRAERVVGKGEAAKFVEVS
mgnify:CR=1